MHAYLSFFKEHYVDLLAIERIENMVSMLREQRDWDQARIQIPEEPDWDLPDFEQYHVQWLENDKPPLQKPEPLEAVREAIYDRIIEYTRRRGDAYEGEACLIHVPPGVGKTTASVRAAQDYVEATGRRVLYVSSRKNFWPEVQDVLNFDPAMWYNWLSLFDDDPLTGEPMCRYREEMQLWIDRGYASYDLCESLCRASGWMGTCPYREQRNRPEPIIFGRHAHLISGMSIKNYRLALCDEMPLSAFTAETRIPKDYILIEQTRGPIRRLLEILTTLANSSDRQVEGPALLALCAGVLEQIYIEFEVLGDIPPLSPSVFSPEQVHNIDYFFVPRLLKMLSPEFECYQKGWANWISRVSVGPRGLVMQYRNHVRKMWRGERPRKLVVLDATGSASLYERILERPLEAYSPRVERTGKTYQIVARQNGFSRTFAKQGKKIRLLKRGRELLGLATLIAEQYEGERVGVVTFKAIEHFFALRFGEDNVLHFGGLRGSNILESCRCLIIAGGYTPNIYGLQSLAAQINPDRMKPFVRIDDGRIMNPWTRELKSYRMKDGGDLAPFYPIGGFWEDTDLSLLLEEYRKNEMTQAIHRSRLVSRDTDVWVLTTIPTDEPLDAIYDDLGNIPFIPKRDKTKGAHGMGMTWQNWTKVKPTLDIWWEAGREAVTVADLADAAGLQTGTAQSQHWIEHLDEYFQFSDDRRRWAAQVRRPEGAARYQRVLVPISEPS